MPDISTEELGTSTWLTNYDKQKIRKMYNCATGPSPPSPTGSCKTVNRIACVFPFKYKGQTYSQCTTVDSALPWCATRKDRYGDVIPGAWDDCGSGCSGVTGKVGGVFIFFFNGCTGEIN